jgi:hypothetical protein
MRTSASGEKIDMLDSRAIRQDFPESDRMAGAYQGGR